MSAAPPMASARSSPTRSSPRGRWRAAVRGLAASIQRSTTRLVAIAQVRAPTMAAVTQPTVRQPGQPPAARTIAMYANGRANTVCSNLIASSRWRARPVRLTIWLSRASEAVVVPAARDEVAHLVGHADLVRPRLRDVVERPLLRRVHAELAAVTVAQRRVIEVVHRPFEDHEVAPGIDVAGGAPGDLREVVHF